MIVMSTQLLITVNTSLISRADDGNCHFILIHLFFLNAREANSEDDCTMISCIFLKENNNFYT